MTTATQTPAANPLAGLNIVARIGRYAIEFEAADTYLVYDEDGGVVDDATTLAGAIEAADAREAEDLQGELAAEALECFSRERLLKALAILRGA